MDEEITEFIESLTTMKVVEDIMEVCGAANISYYSESYRHRVNHRDLVDENLIRDQFIWLMKKELDQLGIEFNMDLSELCSQNHYIECLIELRSRLDKENLTAFFASLSPENCKNKIISQFVNDENRQDHGLVWYLVQEIKARSPLHVRLNMLSQYMVDVVFNNEKFFDHVNAVIEDSDEKFATVDLQDNDLMNIETYMKQHAKARKRFRTAVSSIKHSFSDSVDISIEKSLKIFDRAGNSNIRDNVSNISGGHHKKNRYHPSYLSNAYKKDQEILKEDFYLFTAFLYAFIDAPEIPKQVKDIVKRYHLPDSVTERINAPLKKIERKQQELPKGGEI